MRPVNVHYTGQTWIRDEEETTLIPALEGLMRGWVSLLHRPFQLNSRGYYGSADNPRQKGETSYSVTIALPRDVRTIKHVANGLTFKANLDKVLRLGEIPIDTMYLPEDYRSFSANNPAWESLVPYTAIFFGPTRGLKKLEPIHYGEGIRAIMDALIANEPAKQSDYFQVERN
jgi:hypothetical protein